MAPPIASVVRPAGTVLGGKYRLGKLLGEGGMGAVYEATSLVGGERYAVKILHEEMASNANVVERFLAEGDVCRRLDHPGILRVFDMGNEGGIPYLVMELLQGRALIDYTEHGQRLPVNFAVTVCAGVLHALDYAHSRHVIHRDLKPENVFLCAGANGQYHAKLLDFGIARAIDAAGGAKRRTATGVLLGTPGYMSPEQVKSARNVDHRADLWAVGVMFYEMVSASVAFPSDGDDPNNIWGLISAVLTKEPVPLSTWDPQLAPFDAFIKRALHKDIAQRYQSAREMSEDLVAISRGEAPRPSVVAAAPAYPINSRGELPAIPQVESRASGVVSHPGPMGGPDVGRTVPTGGEQDILARLGGTVPMTGGPLGLAPQAHAAPQNALGGTMLARDSGLPNATALGAPQGVAGTVLAAPAGGGVAGTVLAAPAGGGVAGTVLAAPAAGGVAGTVLAAPAIGSPFVTAPSGFAPPARDSNRPSAPVIPPPVAPSSAAAEGGGMLLWIVLGVVLIVGLGGAVFWALH
jgi:serine/threonine-protein kinase